METGIAYGNVRTDVVNQISTIQATFTATGLESQTVYLVGAYVNTTVGVSDIEFKVFKTSKSSNGAAIKISFT